MKKCKKLALLAGSAALLLTSVLIKPVTSHAAKEPDVLGATSLSGFIGDLNGDGEVNKTDLLRLRNYLNGWSDASVEQTVADLNNDGVCDASDLMIADLNKDDKVDAIDLVLLARYVSGWEGYESYISYYPKMIVSNPTVTKAQTHNTFYKVTKIQTGLYDVESFGSGTKVTVSAKLGLAPYTYRWYKDGVLAEGQTKESIVVMALGTYTCEVSDSSGWTATRNVTFRASEMSVFADQTSYTLNELPFPELKISTEGGMSPKTYRWYDSAGNLISGATSNTYQPSAIGTYQCVVTDKAGQTGKVSYEVKAIGITASVKNGTSQYIPADALSTATKQLSITAQGIEPLSYQWYLNDTKITGATADTYNASQEGVYTCTVKDGIGQTKTLKVKLTDNRFHFVKTNDAKSLVGKPENNYKVTLTAEVANGTGPYYFTWYYGDTADFMTKEANPKQLYQSGALDSRSCSHVITVDRSSAWNGKYIACTATCRTRGISTDLSECYAEPMISAEYINGVKVTGESREYFVGTAPTTLRVDVQGGVGNFTYTWYNMGLGTIGSNSNTITIYDTQISNASRFIEVYCMVTDSEGHRVNTREITLRK